MDDDELKQIEAENDKRANRQREALEKEGISEDLKRELEKYSNPDEFDALFSNDD